MRFGEILIDSRYFCKKSDLIAPFVICRYTDVYIVAAKIFEKFLQKYLVVTKISYTFVLWRGGRVVDCGGLENR